MNNSEGLLTGRPGEQKSSLPVVDDGPTLFPHQPFGETVVIALKVEKTSQGGIFLPEKARENAKRGQVIGTAVAVGPGRRTLSGQLVPCDCKPGDRVLFRFGGMFVNIDGEEFAIIKDSEIILKFA